MFKVYKDTFPVGVNFGDPFDATEKLKDFGHQNHPGFIGNPAFIGNIIGQEAIGGFTADGLMTECYDVTLGLVYVEKKFKPLESIFQWKAEDLGFRRFRHALGAEIFAFYRRYFETGDIRAAGSDVWNGRIVALGTVLVNLFEPPDGNPSGMLEFLAIDYYVPPKPISASRIEDGSVHFLIACE